MMIDESHTQSHTILLVEDNPAHAKLITRCLEGDGGGGRVLHVANGEAALDYLLQRGTYGDIKPGDTPRIVLLDLRLPGIGGLEVLREIKATAALRWVPVVVLTSSDAPSDVEAAYREGANCYVVKPSEFAELRELMVSLSRFWLDWNVAADGSS